jgi:hypothetical protein
MSVMSGNLHLLIGNWLEAHPVGRIYYAPLDVVFSDIDVVEPDLLYVSNERAAEVVIPLHVRGTPELVVEIASKGTRKRDETISAKPVPTCVFMSDVHVSARYLTSSSAALFRRSSSSSSRMTRSWTRRACQSRQPFLLL